MSTCEAGALAASALVAGGTLLRITLQTPSAEQVATLSRLSCLAKALRRAAQPVWRELCLARWPSSATLRAHADEERAWRAWRAFAFARSAAELPSLSVQLRASWESQDLLPFVARRQPLLLLDVSVCEAVIFSARLGTGPSDDLLCFADQPYDEDGIVADDDDPADEFAEAHQQLHISGDDAIPAFPERLLLLHSRGMNQLDAAECLVADIDSWNDEDDDAASSGSDSAITAQLCIMQPDGKIAVLHLGTAMEDRSGAFDYLCQDEMDMGMSLNGGDARWQVTPSGVLRWAGTFAAPERSRRHRAFGECIEAGFDVILNLYCLSESVDVDAVEAAAESESATSSSLYGSESDISAGEDAVRQVAADRHERLQRLRDALRAHDAERAVLSRQLADCMEGRPGGAGSKPHKTDLDDIAAADLVPSPRVSDSSQHEMTTASDSRPDRTAAPTTRMRLALASLSLGWLPAGDIGAELMREAWAAEHGLPLSEVDDERELTESEEEAVQDAEAAHFWAQLDAKMPWLRDN